MTETKRCACLRLDDWDCMESRHPCACHWEGGSEHGPECSNNRDYGEPCSCRCHDESRADDNYFAEEGGEG